MSAMSSRERHISIRLPEQELEVLEKYCKDSKRTKTEVIRSLSRSLKKKVHSK
jgi:hypothetical protein